MSVTEPEADPSLTRATRREIARVRASGCLGDSGRLRELFDFLADRDERLPPPKEVEIAVAVFGKAESDSLKDDPVARVYVHRLRRRLDDFYRREDSPEGLRLEVPKGQYRLIGVRPGADAAAPDGAVPNAAPQAGEDAAARPAAVRRPWPLAIATGVAALLLANVAAWAIFAARTGGDAHAHAADHPVWTGMTDHARPVLIVVGDYYMFGELENGVFLRRLVRDFTINSREELLQRRLEDANAGARYTDVNLDYLPISVAFALGEILPEAPHEKQLRVALASDVTAEMMKTHDIVYVGLLSGLAMLRDPVFAQSRFAVGESYDELIDLETGEAYVTEGFVAETFDGMYRDYGFFSSFAGPSGNRIVIVAGERDTAVTGVAERLGRPGAMAELRQAAGGNADALEAVFEIEGQQNVSLDSRIVIASPLDSATIWSAQNAARTFPRR